MDIGEFVRMEEIELNNSIADAVARAPVDEKKTALEEHCERSGSPAPGASPASVPAG